MILTFRNPTGRYSQEKHPKKTHLQKNNQQRIHNSLIPPKPAFISKDFFWINGWYPTKLVNTSQKKDFDTLIPHHICAFNFKGPPESMPGWQENTWKQWSSDRVRLGFTLVERHFCCTNLVQTTNQRSGRVGNGTVWETDTHFQVRLRDFEVIHQETA